MLALIEGRSLQRQAEAMVLGAEEVLRKGSVENIAAAVQRLIRNPLVYFRHERETKFAGIGVGASGRSLPQG
jgi:hypothetical protein